MSRTGAAADVRDARRGHSGGRSDRPVDRLCPGAEGIACTVLDRRELGREASWAGAGLIPPPCEVRSASMHPTVQLRSWSAELFPLWSAALREETGIDNGFRRTGGVDVAGTEAEGDALADDRWPMARGGDRPRAAGCGRSPPRRARPEPGDPRRLLSSRSVPGTQSLAPSRPLRRGGQSRGAARAVPGGRSAGDAGRSDRRRSSGRPVDCRAAR